MLYYLVPKLWNTKIYSIRLANIHFWFGLLGIILYYVSMVVAGLTQGLMWRAIDAQGKLVYPDFVETVTRIVPLYWARTFGGTLFFVGFLVMVYNIYKTIQAAPARSEAAPVKAISLSSQCADQSKDAHRRLEGMPMLFTVLTLIAILVGSVIEIYPTLSLKRYLPESDIANVRAYSPLELAGRDVYIKEGCYTCHSQQIRPIASEVLRYGKASTIADSMYDHPFQWGSKRIGPDLARVGKKYPDLWHYRHMMDPRAITSQSIMPDYKWLADNKVDFLILRRKLSILRNLGTPYTDDQVAQADILAEKQAKEIALGLEQQGVQAGLEKTELVALIAYLQSLGQLVNDAGGVK
jgi:cytochrome c oxidase cbb3-type subunit I/II